MPDFPLPADYFNGGQRITPIDESEGGDPLVALLNALRVAADGDYTPSEDSHWSPVPTTVGEALDQLAARVDTLEP